MNVSELQALYASGEAVVKVDEAEPWKIVKTSRASWYRAMAAGEVPGTLRLGRARRLQLRALLEFLGALPDGSTDIDNGDPES